MSRSVSSRVANHRFLLAAALAMAGCVGTVGPEGDDVPGRAPDPAVSPSSPGTATPPTAPPVEVPVDRPAGPAACKTPRPGPSPLRRLTRFEYDNTVRDLLGDTTSPARRFPPEEGSLGFDNDANALRVSRVLAEAYLDTAAELAGRAVQNLNTFLGCDPGATPATEEACVRKFLDRFGTRAFRRPITADEATELVATYRAARAFGDVKSSVSLVVEAVLVAPPFLYRAETGGAAGAVVKVAPWELASRLSYFLWGSMPDEPLFEAARAGKLTTAADVAAQAQRMLKDPRARQMARHFHRLWLDLSAADGVQKDPMRFPRFTAEIGPLLRQESEAFVEDVLFDGDGRLATLLTAPHTMLNAKLAAYYGVKNGPPGAAFARVAMDPKQRAGIVTHGSVMSVLATGDRTHPIQRGIFVRRQLLCSPPPDPPPGATEMPVTKDVSATATARERLAAHRDKPECSGCHRLIDPIGFGLEAYDAAGVFRATENGKPVDVAGEIVGTDAQGPFAGAVELAARLGASDDARRCATLHWFRFAAGRAETEGDACSRAATEAAFAASGGNLRELLVAFTQTDAFLYRTAGGGQ